MQARFFSFSNNFLSLDFFSNTFALIIIVIPSILRSIKFMLSLRSDNADLRLTHKGIKIGLISKLRKEFFEDKFEKLSKISMQMVNLNISPSKADKFGIKIAKDGVFRSAEEILTQKDVNMRKIREIWPETLNHGSEIDQQIEINSHYRGYLKKQKADILAFKRDENLSIPDGWV